MDSSAALKLARALRALAALLFCCLAPPAAATQISFVDTFRNLGYAQTGNGNSLAFSGAFFSADLNALSQSAYTSVMMSFPGPGSPVSLPEVSPPSTDYHYQTATLPSQAAMDAAFPTGTYTFTTNTTDTADLAYSADDYALSLPYLTGSDFSDLQGLNPAQPFTFHISPFSTGSTADFSFIFLTIFDFTSNMFVFDAGFLPSTTTTIVLPADTLSLGHSFVYDLDFSNRDIVTGQGGTFPPQLGFDVRTGGTFETAAVAVPEPSAPALWGIGLVAMLMGLRRRRVASQNFR